jgi:ADP-heptose:LPS heptosyltransferase
LIEREVNFQNILVIHFGQLGDVVLGLPALAALRKHFSASRLTVLCGMAPGEVVRLSGLADEVVTVDRVDLRDGPRLRSVRRIFKLVTSLREKRFDLVVDLHSLSETNILAFLTTAKQRLLANREGRSLDRLSNFRPAPPPEDKNAHLTDRYFDVLRPLNIADRDRTFRLSPAEADSRFVDERFFAGGEVTVGLFPGAGHPDRCWPIENFAELASRVIAGGKRPAVVLGPEEGGMRAQISDSFPAGTTIIDGLTIAQFIAAAARLDAFVTNDTGPMHLAAAAGCPIVLVLDEKAPSTYLPLVAQLQIVGGSKIADITVDEVHAGLTELLSRSRSAGK